MWTRRYLERSRNEADKRRRTDPDDAQHAEGKSDADAFSDADRRLVLKAGPGPAKLSLDRLERIAEEGLLSEEEFADLERREIIGAKAPPPGSP